MAIDSRQKRMSAILIVCPWRGPLVDASESSFTQGNRQAAALFYSGILAAAAAGLSPGDEVQVITTGGFQISITIATGTPIRVVISSPLKVTVLESGGQIVNVTI